MDSIPALPIPSVLSSTPSLADDGISDYYVTIAWIRDIPRIGIDIVINRYRVDTPGPSLRALRVTGVTPIYTQLCFFRENIFIARLFTTVKPGNRCRTYLSFAMSLCLYSLAPNEKITSYINVRRFLWYGTQCHNILQISKISLSWLYFLGNILMTYQLFLA